MPKRQPPWDKPPEPEGSVSFGDWLRRQREMREISLRDIADRTKISLRYLEAMEDNRFDLLPAPIFAKGFLREYARYVGLSPDEVVNHYL
ncbi:MAG TPA: helix-turn-helix transcriptional regulator, partial [Thermoanaerobaculia bacterium]|nr:helix-turn-helix transcriptional regulator [Thermoanaerobaculia bacterium]